jgi:uncharacterized FlaG/YvyC family protein
MADLERNEVRKQEPVEKLLDPFPEAPPAEALEALDKAQEVLAELKAKQINLQFRVDEEANRIEVVVYDGTGHVLREVPPTDALDILAGEKPVGLGFEAHG